MPPSSPTRFAAAPLPLCLASLRPSTGPALARGECARSRQLWVEPPRAQAASKRQQLVHQPAQATAPDTRRGGSESRRSRSANGTDWRMPGKGRSKEQSTNTTGRRPHPTNSPRGSSTHYRPTHRMQDCRMIWEHKHPNKVGLHKHPNNVGRSKRTADRLSRWQRYSRNTCAGRIPLRYTRTAAEHIHAHSGCRPPPRRAGAPL